MTGADPRICCGGFNRLQLILYVMLAASIIVGLGGCSSGLDESGPDNATQTQTATQNQKQASSKVRKEAGPASPKPDAPNTNWITKASFTPHKVDSGSALKLEVETTIPKEEKEYSRFSYIYWKNGQKLMESDTNILEPGNYKKDDIIYADVLLFIDNTMAEKSRSETVQIANSSPRIIGVKLPKIEGPGTYRIPVESEDIDGDSLSFSVDLDEDQAPLPESIKLSVDSATGTVSFTLGEDAPPKHVKFIITADDGDGGKAQKAVSFTFNVTRKKKQDDSPNN
jgi:hypothetical protein